MTIYTEFREDIERRRARLARAQFWFRKRSQLKWAIFAFFFAVVVGTAIVVNLRGIAR